MIKLLCHWIVAILIGLTLTTNPALAFQDLADVIEQAEKSVVRINVESNQGSSLGSGYVVATDGMIATNVHVMAGARKATATFKDGRSYQIKGTLHIDESRDICICKIEASDMKVLPIASSLPRKGESVTALGSPRGLSFTATRGIVSAIRGEKEMNSDSRRKVRGTWIQVDAPLSPGNSGGPLINQRGELVAMSTLASFGMSQNLNFGISNSDIKNAITKASYAPIVGLKAGASKVEMENESSSSGIARIPVPESALEDYIALGKEEFSYLTKELRKEYARINKTYSAMKRGKTFTRSGAPVERQIGKTIKYAFASERIKRRVLRDQEKRVRSLQKTRDAIGREMTDEGLLELLWGYGPEINPRKKGSVGFLNEAIVLQAATEHDVVVVYEGVPYLIWVKDSSGLSIGQELTPWPVHVVGARTMMVQGEGSVAVTILNSVTRNELEKAMFPGGRDFRTWTSKNGSFSKDAKYISHTEINVVLETKNGQKLTVPIDKLCEEDQQFVHNK